MAKFEELGFANFDEYVEHFFNTLLPTNKTYEYFVNWNKVKTSIQKYIDEFGLINSLTKLQREERPPHLHHLFKNYPKVVEIIPLLIAERAQNNKIDIFDPMLNDFINFDFCRARVNDDTIPKLVKFCDKTGIIDLFEEIKDINDYLLGVEVGLDSNARKNRSGAIFANMVKKFIKRKLGSKCKVVFEDPRFSLYEKISRGSSKPKTHDIVGYSGSQPKIVIECNFYNTTGSKPISIAESYIEMSRSAKAQNIEFLWVTDGPAWRKMKEPLLRAMQRMEWIFNFKMLNNVEVIVKN